jgi:hypothetical protein
MGRFRGNSIWLGVIAVSFLTGCGAVFINQGSKNASLAAGLQNPEANKAKINVPADQSIIGNFDDGSKNVNSKLFGGGGGQWMTITFGGNTIDSDFVVDGGANGTPKAAHIFGSLADRGDKTYPAFQLQCKFKDSGYYDASNFNGLSFYYKCPADDTALKRRFGIGTAPTLPGDQGGTCASNCYDLYGTNLNPTNDWLKITLAFTDAKREGWGAPVTPPDLVDHLKEFINLQWQHSANNVAGTYTIDYWVDEVQFF